MHDQIQALRTGILHSPRIVTFEYLERARQSINSHQSAEDDNSVDQSSDGQRSPIMQNDCSQVSGPQSHRHHGAVPASLAILLQILSATCHCHS